MATKPLQKEFLALKEWLKIEGNTKPLIALHLGYQSSNVVDKWLVRKKIPLHQAPRVAAFIGQKS